jgi:hypothetical protein
VLDVVLMNGKGTISPALTIVPAVLSNLLAQSVGDAKDRGALVADEPRSLSRSIFDVEEDIGGWDGVGNMTDLSNAVQAPRP